MCTRKRSSANACAARTWSSISSGILNERGFGGAGFRRAHTELTQGVLQAARSAGVARLLQVSALKAAVDAPATICAPRAKPKS